MKVLKKIKFKTILVVINLLSFLNLTGCECWTVGSKESLDDQENRPWHPDKSTVAGVKKNTSPRHMTPHVGFNMPLDEPSKIVLKTREIPDADSMDPFKTLWDKKNKSVKIVPNKN